MSDIKTQIGRWGRRAAVAAILGVTLGALSACDSLLDVDLPAQLTDQALNNPSSADTQVSSILAQFECGYSAYSWQILGNEDVFEVIAGVASGSHRYFATAPTGGCDSDSEDNDWFDQVSASRAMAADLYDKLQNEWTVEQVPQKERFSAVSALYVASALDHFGEIFCEMTVDGGPLMTPDETLAMGEEWIGRALQHISAAGGDFEIRNGVTGTSDGLGAEVLAHGLRARMRYARGDLSGAVSDAQQVPMGFAAYVTREQGPQRRNKVYDAGTNVGYSGMLGVNDWWDGPANPVTGQPWATPIPFTGYIFLGVMPDGRAVNDDGTPVRWAEEFREMGSDPTPLGNGAVPDTRIQHFKKTIQGPEPREVPDKYKGEDDDIPFVSWKEMWLIQADVARRNGDFGLAISLVNDLRNDAGLPTVTYLDGGTASDQDIRYMITEEWRRALWLEGRYYPYKVKNTDLLWFPRAVGDSPFQGYAFGGAVRLLMPTDEYELNENLTLADRGTGCPAGERPIF